jgi:hypothetical protein
MSASSKQRLPTRSSPGGSSRSRRVEVCARSSDNPYSPKVQESATANIRGTSLSKRSVNRVERAALARRRSSPSLENFSPRSRPPRRRVWPSAACSSQGREDGVLALVYREELHLFAPVGHEGMRQAVPAGEAVTSPLALRIENEQGNRPYSRCCSSLPAINLRQRRRHEKGALVGLKVQSSSSSAGHAYRNRSPRPLHGLR